MLTEAKIGKLNSQLTRYAVDDGLNMIERLVRTGSMLPEGVAYAVSDSLNGFQFVTYAQIKANRIEEQKKHLKGVQFVASPVRRAGYIWVFYTAGIGCGLMSGYWTYLRTLNEDRALDFRTYDYRLLEMAMKLFPCGVIPILENRELWKKRFARQFARPGRFRKQGLATVWVYFDKGEVHLEGAC